MLENFWFSAAAIAGPLKFGLRRNRVVFAAGAALAAAGDTNLFENFRRGLLLRFAGEKNSALAQLVLQACLLLPAAPNVMASLQPLARAIAPAAPASIGNPQPAVDGNIIARLKLENIGMEQLCSFTIHDGTITMVGGGSDIYENTDRFAYAFTSVQGDFDYRMQVRSVAPMLDPFTRVGLMARESLSSVGTRHVMVAVNANDTFQVIVRSAENAFSESLPSNPLPPTFGSNSWVRLQRAGPIFHAYTSSNGVDWTELYATAGRGKPFNSMVYFGIVVCAHSAQAEATGIVSDFGATPTVSPDTALTLALLDYRQGDFAQSSGWCRRLLAYPECNAVQAATGRVILALAGWRLNQTADAEVQLAQARDSIRNRFSSGLQSGDPADGLWYDWIVARVLMREADGLIH